MLRPSVLPGIVTAVSWETRERGGRYYTRSKREDGRVVREYVGTGEIAELLAHADEAIRRNREAERARGCAELDRVEGLVAPVLEMDDAVKVLVRASFVAVGYHRHKGEWRVGRDA